MTFLSSSDAPGTVAASTGLAGRLPALQPSQALLSRVTQDARFADWLRQSLQLASLGVALRRAAPLWCLTVESDHGCFRLGVDPTDSPALQLALEHQPTDAACAVVMLLLDDWAQALAPSLGPLRLLAIEPIHQDERTDTAALATLETRATPGPFGGGDRHRQERLPCILGGGMPVALLGADATLLDRLSSLMARLGVDLSPLADWALRPTLRLFSRPLPLQVLRSLQAGDAVLAGGQAPCLRWGIGRVLQARVHIDPLEFTVHLAESPLPADDAAALDPADGVPPTEAPPAVGALDALQLPVAFELDTARISLAALASMQPGYAVELDVPLQEAQVRLVCQGRTLGLGQLMAIGDQLGVRITRLEFSHDATAAR